MTAVIEETRDEPGTPGDEHGEDLEKITELEKFGPERIDGVDFPANGLPALMLKSLGTADQAGTAPAATTPEGHIAAEPTTPDTATADAGPPAADAVKSAEPLGTITLPPSPADMAKLQTYRQRLAMAEAAAKAAQAVQDGEAADAVKADKKGKPQGPTAAAKKKFIRDLADASKNPTAHVSQTLHRCHEWAASGHYPAGMSYSTVRWMAEQCVKELKKRNPDSEASMDGFPAAKAAGPAAPAAKGSAKKCQAEQAFAASCAEDSEGHDTRKAAADGKPGNGKPWKGKKPFKDAAPPYKKGNSGHDAPKPGPAKKAGVACKCGTLMAKGSKFCSACGSPLKGKAAKAEKPFPADAKVGAAISRLKSDADAALAAQAKDPDAETHPADRRVTEELQHVKDDADAAAAAQDKDEDTDTAAQHAAKSEGPAYHLRRLHDATCAAFALEDVVAAHPAAAKGIGELADPAAIGAMVTAALAEDGGTGTRAGDLPGLSAAYQAAIALKALAAQPGVLDEAMAGLRKAFAGYYPDAHPKPGSITPGEFARPYITRGRANESAKPGQKPRIPLASHVPSADDFRRPLITAGHEAASPGSKPAGVGKGRMYYRNTDKGHAETVLTAMHDYIAGTHPSICPMKGVPYDGEDADPNSMGSSLTTDEAATRQFGAAKDKAVPVPVTAGHAASVVTPGPARKSKTAKKERKMAKAARRAEKAAAAAPSAVIDQELLTAALREIVTGPLGDVTKTIGSLEERLAAMESAPDPAQMAPRSGAAAIAKARGAGQEIPAGGDEATQRLMRLMKKTQDPDSGVRTTAIGELVKQVGREKAAELLAAAT